MSLLGNIARKNLALDDPKAWNPSLWNPIGSQSLSGEKVTEETALTYSAVWNAITLIAGTIGSLPLHLMKSDGKNKEFAEDNSLYGLMHDSPNPYLTAMAFREAMMAHVLTWGNGFAEKVFNKMGEIVQLWLIPPNRVRHLEMDDKGVLWYEIQVDSETKWLPRKQILHIPGLGFDGFIGYSPIAMARKSIGLGMAMETFGSHYFGQGTHPGVIVSHPNKLDPQSHANLRTSLSETYSGLGQSHRLMLLEEGLKMENIGIPPNDSQFIESKQHHISDIARWFNVPPHKLKDLTKSSFNNIESEQMSFVTDSILPWLVRLEQNYKMQLIGDSKAVRERDGKELRLFYKHIVEGLLRANSKERAEYYKTLIGTTMMTPNEGREKEDMNPSSNPLADELFVPANNSIPLSMLKEYLTKAQSTNPPVSQTEVTPADDESQQPVNVLKLGSRK